MRVLRGMIAGALALASIVFVGSAASARTVVAPELTQVTATAAATAAETAAAAPCYYGARWRGGYGWHRPYYGWRRPHYYRPYGFYRPYGYGFRRPYRYGRPYGWRRHGWRRW